MPDLVSFSRHDLLLPEKDCPVTADPRCMETIREWLACGRPVIVRRPCLTEEGLHCGIPLPPGQGWKRLAFTLDPAGIAKRLSLPRLEECLELLTQERRKPLSGLAQLSPEVFGSLAWQFLTGLSYLHEKSDVDLLFRVRGRNELRFLCAALSELNPPEFCDIEVMFWNGRAFCYKEWRKDTPDVLLKGNHDISLYDKTILSAVRPDAKLIAWEAEAALLEELETYPKPGLVSDVDSGSHRDMNASHFRAGIAALRDYFLRIAEAGMRNAPMEELKALGLDAEKRMFETTGGINTHRGAIFSIGMLAAAAGFKTSSGSRASLGEIVLGKWGSEILKQKNPGSHGEEALRRYGGNGARMEVASGFPSIYGYGLPAFREALEHTSANAARLEAFFTLLERVNDTTLLHRGGRAGHDFAVEAAIAFRRASEEEKPKLALETHREFIRRNLSCGGVADLLSATIFIHRMEELWEDS